MRPLSPAYHHDLIHCVIQNKSFQCLKHLVLSSQQMSRGFETFMRDVIVSYDRGSFCFRTLDNDILVRYYVSWYFKDWITPFVRRLWINRTPLRNEEIGFLEDVYRCNKVIALNAVKLTKKVMTLPVVINLMSVSRHITVDYWYQCFGTSLRRFQTVFVNFQDSHASHKNKFKPFRIDVDSKVLELISDNNAFTFGYDFLMYKLSKEVDDLRHLIVTVENVPDNNSTNVLFDQLSKYPNMKSVKFGIRLNHSSMNCTAIMKTEFYNCLQTLRESPNSIKVTMVFFNDARSIKSASPLFTSDVFPPDDFDITPDRRVCTNRQTTITENVKLFFRCEC